MNDKEREALRIIANWELPPTGKFWDAEKTRPTSYESEYGSNGARDYMRATARAALDAPVAPEPWKREAIHAGLLSVFGAPLKYDAELIGRMADAIDHAQTAQPSSAQHPAWCSGGCCNPEDAPVTDFRDLLEQAYNGLKWYRDAHPEDDSGADDELYAKIEATLDAHEQIDISLRQRITDLALLCENGPYLEATNDWFAKQLRGILKKTP